MTNYFKKLASSDLLALIISIIYFLVLFINIDYLRVPHGDVYQYISDAKHYAAFELPWLIQLQPLVPAFIAILNPFFGEFDYPYFAVAKFINIASGSGIIFTSYLILKKFLSPLHALVVAVMMAIHPIAIITNLDITNISSYAFLSLLALYFLDKDKKFYFIIASLAFLVRIEALVLIIPYFAKYFTELKIESISKHRYLLIFLLMVISFTLFQSTHNWQNQVPYANRYLEEMAIRDGENDSLSYLVGLFGTYFFPDLFEYWNLGSLSKLSLSTLLLSSISLFMLIVIILSKKTRPFGLYILSLSLVHVVFPAFEVRYFYLFLNIFLIGIVINADTILSRASLHARLVVVLLVYGLYLLFVSTSYSQSFGNYRHGYMGHDLNYELSEWIFNQKAAEKYYFVVREPFLYSGLFLNKKENVDALSYSKSIITRNELEYFTVTFNQREYVFIDLPRVSNRCEHGKCAIGGLNDSDAYWIVILDTISMTTNDQVWLEENGISLIRSMSEKDQCLEKIKEISNDRAWFKAFKLDIQCYLDWQG